MNGDEEVLPQEDVEVKKFGSLAGLEGLQYRETISLVVFGFGSLEMTAVLDLQFVQLVLLGQLIQCRGRRVVQVVPGNARQRLGHAGHGIASIRLGWRRCEMR